MLNEITAAALFLVQLIEKNEKFSQDQVECFGRRLVELLTERFENHWFPDKPFKGQGYRCIRVNGHSRRDSTLESAAYAAGVKYEDLSLPVELTLWVDPHEVCCRFGESKGSYCTLASFERETTPPTLPNNNKENIPSNGGSKQLQKNPTTKSNNSEKKALGGSAQNQQQQQQQPHQPQPQQTQATNASAPVASKRRNSNSPRSHPSRNRSWFNHSFGGMAGFGAHPMSQAWYGVMPPHFIGGPSPPPFVGHRGNKWMHPSSYPGASGVTTRFQHHWSTPRATLKV